MPTLIDRREGEHVIIGGVVVVIGIARDRHATLLIGGQAEAPATVKKAAAGMAAKHDDAAQAKRKLRRTKPWKPRVRDEE